MSKNVMVTRLTWKELCGKEPQDVIKTIYHRYRFCPINECERGEVVVCVSDGANESPVTQDDYFVNCLEPIAQTCIRIFGERNHMYGWNHDDANKLTLCFSVG